MNDKEYNIQKKRVQKLINKWRRPIGMGWWRIEFAFTRERNADEYNCVAMTESRWQYRYAAITFYLPAVADNDDDFLENIVVHEFSHVLISSMAQAIPEEHQMEHEYATECVAQAILWAREAGSKDT